MPRPAVLYISYDGMLEPLGQGQVIAYLEGLAPAYAIRLISYEKPADLADRARVADVAGRLARARIGWHRLAYHRRPTVPATLYDIAVGVIVAAWLVVRHRVRIIHARSYVAALIGLIVKRLTGARLLFDMRGLWADERVDGGLWRTRSGLYRGAKAIERVLLGDADHIVTLTYACVPVVVGLAAGQAPPITVIPTCADLDRFAPALTPPALFTLGWVGAVGTWAMFGEVLACFAAVRARRPDARLLVVNRGEHAAIRAAIAGAGIDPAACEIVAGEHRDIPASIARMSAGAALYRASFANVARAPTKLAEYLGCGVPCLGSAGVGDMAALLEGERVGVVADAAARIDTIDRLLALCDDPATPERCRHAALRHFSLAEGVARYGAVYRDLLA